MKSISLFTAKAIREISRIAILFTFGFIWVACSVTAMAQTNTPMSINTKTTGGVEHFGDPDANLGVVDGPKGSCYILTTVGTFTWTNGTRTYFKSPDGSNYDGTIFYPAPGPGGLLSYYVGIGIHSGGDGTYYLHLTNQPSTNGWDPWLYNLLDESQHVSVPSGTDNYWGLASFTPSFDDAPAQTCYVEAKEDVFGLDPVLDTHIYVMKSDANYPTSNVIALASPITNTTFTVSWAGQDNGSGASGVWKYDVQYKMDAGSWTDWQVGTTATSASFTGSAGHTYYFQSRAYDNVNHIEAYPGGNGDTYTTIQALPIISLTPTTLAPICTQGSNAASQSFDVWNSGGGTLSYSISDNQTWLSCSPTSGTSTGEHDAITVSYSTSGLAAGTHTATITVSASGVTSQTIAVTLTDTAAATPAISLSPTTLAPGCIQGTNATSQSFDVWNSGTGTLNYSVSDNQTWLSCSPTSGTSTGEHDAITVNYSTSGLAVGTYTATITVSASGVTSRTVAVTLTVSATPTPIISLTPTTLTTTCATGSNAASQSFEVWNSGTGTLSYTISDNQTWLSCSPTSGTSTGEHDAITVSYTTSGLTAGSYTATITVSASGVTSQTVAVTLTVNTVGTDPYEPNDVYASAYHIYYGDSLTAGIIDPEADYDWFYFDGAIGDSVQITAYANGTLGGSTLDSYLKLYSSNGSTLLDSNDDWAGHGWSSRIDYVLGVSGRYYIKVHQFSYKGSKGVAGPNSKAQADNIHYGYKGPEGDQRANSKAIEDNYHLVLKKIILPPAISLSPTSLYPSCTPGSNAVSQSFSVWNSGGGTLSYTVGEATPWLSCTPTSGTSTGEHDAITVNYTSSGLAAGTYPATITVSASGATSRTVSVSLTVGGGGSPWSWDQSADPTSVVNGFSAQNFETANDVYDCWGGDDFFVQGVDSAIVKNVSIVGSYSTTGPTDSLYLSITTDSSGYPALSHTVWSGRILPANYTDNAGSFLINLPNWAHLMPGHYWFVMQAMMNYTPAGQWYWAAREVVAGTIEGAWFNPGNGFSNGVAWMRLSAGPASPDQRDFRFTLNGTHYGVEGQPTVIDKPRSFSLLSNYPNPVRGSTTFSFNLPKTGLYTIKVYNISGQLVYSQGGLGKDGMNKVTWNAHKDCAGVYFYNLSYGGRSATQKLVVVK